jgi:hypothetical protein
MDKSTVQAKLSSLYNDWKSTLQIKEEHAKSLWSPFLIHVTDDYCSAKKRILVLGQETRGWGFNSEEQASYLRYPQAWPADDIWTMEDFIADDNAVEALCRGYEAFDFARLYKGRSSPFWRAFREVQAWPQAGVLWGNLVRSAYLSTEATDSSSILRASNEIRNVLVERQKNLFLSELSILDPHICLFFTGPNYDSILAGTLVNCEFIACNSYPVRQLAKLAHSALPAASYRTYHPRSLNRQKLWDYIEAVRLLAYNVE